MAWGSGDFNADGKVDINDLTIVLSHYNQSLGASAAGMTAVPEPSGVGLFGIGAISLMAYAWRRLAQRRCANTARTTPVKTSR